MAERIRAINPACVVTEIEEFVMPENTAALLDRNFDVVIDAIDQVRAKVAMIAWCRRQNLPIVVAGGAGGKIDPSRIRLDDLSRTEQDPLIARVRSQLRKEHGFTRDPKKKFWHPGRLFGRADTAAGIGCRLRDGHRARRTQLRRLPVRRYASPQRSDCLRPRPRSA